RFLSRNLIAAAAPTGTRGISWRRFLSPLAAAGARRQDEPEARRRLAHRFAHYRNAGGRRIGLYSDERYFHHRWPDLSGNRSVQFRRAPGGKRGTFGQPRGWQRANQSHAAGGWNAEAGAGPVPRAGRVRPVRQRSG